MAPSLLWGNPYGAEVFALEPLNEPNQLWRPQISDQDNSRVNIGVCNTAVALQTAEAALYAWGQGTMGMLAPATSDVDDPSTDNFTNYLEFTQGVMALLQNWMPRVSTTWSHHNYRDMLYHVTARVANVTAAMNTYQWKQGLDHAIFVTEGGYAKDTFQPADIQSQANAINAAFANQYTVGNVYSLAQHQIYDGSVAASGLYYPPPPNGIQEYPAQPAWGDQPRYGSV